VFTEGVSQQAIGWWQKGLPECLFAASRPYRVCTEEFNSVAKNKVVVIDGKRNKEIDKTFGKAIAVLEL